MPGRLTAVALAAMLVLALAVTGLAGCGVSGAGSGSGTSSGTAPDAGSAAGEGTPSSGADASSGDTGVTVVDGVQRVTVDTSRGTFNPDVITVSAGIPLEITFSQAPGGCLSGVIIPDFEIAEDLTDGAKTISLPALEPGEYPFYCQMYMISAMIVAK